MSDFYLEITKKPVISYPEKLKHGEFNYGFWYSDIETSETEEGEKFNYSIGIASDRRSPQYTISVSKDCICVDAEKFGLSPVFYSQLGNDIFISSSIKLLMDKLKAKCNLKINKRFLLEQNLFNYSLFNNTIFEEIKLVPANCKVVVKDNLSIEEIFRIEDYFTDRPVSYKKSIHDLVDLFITLNAPKIHNGDYISFTSGFDGRSLLALALSHNKKIHTYSFGSSDNIDLFMPRQQAKRLDVDFYPVLLDDKAYINSFIKLGEEVITSTVGNSNLLQLHWVYAAKTLQGKTDTLVTGMFGSELFRAAHIAGQFTSPALVDYFKYLETDQWISGIRNSDSLKFLNKNNFINETDSLITDLQEYKNKIIGLSENQRFYKYIFDETFSKFFGLQFIQPMRQYMNVINPYLDFEFVKELLKTELAGVNNVFFTHNPFKRLKGQLFYAELIRKTSSQLYTLMTGKGYSPEDLLSLKGKIKIAVSFTQKRFHKKIGGPQLNNLGILSGIKTYGQDLLLNGFNSEYYNKKFFIDTVKSDKWEKDEIVRNKFIETISTKFYLESL